MNTYKRWFSRVVWLGIAVNVYFSLLTILVPNQILSYLSLQTAEPTVWVSFSGNLLILLSLFYIMAAVDPDRYRPAAWLAIFSRFTGVLFFGAMVAFGAQNELLRLALADLVFGSTQFVLLRMATREERNRVPDSPRWVMWRRAIIGAAVVVVLVTVSVGWFSLFRQVPQSFDSIEDRFKYGSIGAENNEGVPYWIWLVLPRIFPEKLPGPGGYVSLGATWEEGRELPIGFSKKTIGFPRVAINCAFCHVATFRKSPQDKPEIFLGGPAHQFDPQKYQRFLFESAADPQFNADRILEAMEYSYDFSLFDRFLYRYIIIPRAKSGMMEQKEQFDWTYKLPDWGHGRIDPFNPVKFRMLKQPFDGTIGNSDMVPIWNLRPRVGMSLHWDGLNSVIPDVTRSSALGDGATPRTIPIDDLNALESWLMDVKPPAFPFPIDGALAAQGQPVWEQHCATCHSFGGERTGKVIPLEEVGTDRHRLDMWTAGSVEAYNNFADGYDWDFKGFVKTNGYVAAPLDGVWIRAPYLHNGSVPTLRDLLEPPAQRPQVFYRGYDVYDPAAGGFISNVPEEAGKPFTRFSTADEANSSKGHLYGTDLSPGEKVALVEYLKTL
jgi:hypothetical protein